MTWKNPCLKPGKFRKSKKKIYGFDIETHGQKNEFLCASIVGDDYCETFYDKDAVIEAFQHSRFRNSLVAATNLSFDFFGVFDKREEMQCFRTLFRGSSLLFAKTHLDSSSRFFLKTIKEQKVKGTLTFIDTLNYAQMSVEDMGKVLGYEKLDMDGKIGMIPESREEWHKLVTYNIRDAEISRKFMRFLYDGFESMGATPKLTLASTAMSLFRNQFLKDIFFVHKQNDILDLMQGYYGGRTEAFRRGIIREANYYDVNSMYPHCMRKALPDPNSHRVTHKDTLEYIMKYEGMSEVKVFCPLNLKIPYLPYRWNGKLVFPTGEFGGWYTHFELRKAMSMGYDVRRVIKTHYYRKTCRPLKEYAEYLYRKRQELKKEGSPMQLVTKLLLNSLYGKFGQKFLGRETYTPISNFTHEQLQELDDFERVGEFIKHKKDSDPAHFCIPIWSSYITAYARDMLFGFLTSCDPWYCDTDSIITKSELETSDELGDMKLEMCIKEGVIVKPKMYALIDQENKEHVKIKGVRKRVLVGGVETYLDYGLFIGLEDNPALEYKKFMKFKEAQRRGMTVNEIIPMMKELDLEDNKRSWQNDFSWKESQRSLPLVMIDGVESEYRKELVRKARYAAEERVEKEMLEFIDSDLFDKGSVGVDICPVEFIENEIFFETGQ